MNIFLLGYKGYLGSYFRKHLNVDVVIENKKYDYFINCASKTSLEYCEEHPLESQASNLDVLSDIHKRIPEAKIISFSSYYVYDDVGLCTEAAKTTDKYQYTKHKLLGESYTTRHGGVVFRLGKLFGNPYSSQNRLTEALLESSSITLDEVSFNPTSVRQVLDVVKHELRGGCLEGVYNLSNKGHSTHAEYGNFVNDRRKISMAISIISRQPRQFHNYGKFLMDTSKLEKSIKLRHWKDDLQEYLKCIA
jgi:dTDP-4-dehydrorhamnose reductase